MVNHPRSPASIKPEAGCSLLRGEPACHCLREVGHLTDEQVLSRATEMFRWHQLATPGGRAAARRGLDALLADARSHRGPSLVTPLLGIGIGLRVHGGRRADIAETEMLLTEFRERAEGADDCLLRGEAATLRAHHNAVFSAGENPIYAAAEALAVLTDLVEAGPNDDRAD
jgi:hypothetical protein